jgi:5-methylcytosine-specific restriction protein A
MATTRSRRAEFTKKTKAEAFQRAAGRCEACGERLGAGEAEFDHYPLRAADGGPATLDNCQVLCVGCHRRKTSKVDIPEMAKTKRIHRKLAGKCRPKAKIGGGRKRLINGSKGTPFKVKIGGKIERRENENDTDQH